MSRPDPDGESGPAPRYQRILAQADELARVMGHAHVGVEHLFLAIIRDRAAMPTQALAQTVDPAELHREFLAYMQAAYPEPFRELPAYPEPYVPDFTGAERVWLPRSDLDTDLVVAMSGARPGDAAFGFNYSEDRGWVEVGPPGDTRSVLSAALQALGREPLAPQ
jgi:hypothetical protein